MNKTVVSNKQIKDYIYQHTGIEAKPILLKCIRDPKKLDSVSEGTMEYIVQVANMLIQNLSGILDGPEELTMINTFLIVLEDKTGVISDETVR